VASKEVALAAGLYRQQLALQVCIPIGLISSRPDQESCRGKRIAVACLGLSGAASLQQSREPVHSHLFLPACCVPALPALQGGGALAQVADAVLAALPAILDDAELSEAFLE
jgi:hypothetical protein